MESLRTDFEPPKIRFYKYFFKGVEKPIIMEAEDREMADQMLGMLPEKSGVEIDMDRLENVKIETPLTGVSKKTTLGQTYIWVGFSKSQDGWMLETEYQEIVKAYED